jgi:hypothetical protein
MGDLRMNIDERLSGIERRNGIIAPNGSNGIGEDGEPEYIDTYFRLSTESGSEKVTILWTGAQKTQPPIEQMAERIGNEETNEYFRKFLIDLRPAEKRLISRFVLLRGADRYLQEQLYEAGYPRAALSDFEGEMCDYGDQEELSELAKLGFGDGSSLEIGDWLPISKGRD